MKKLVCVVWALAMLSIVALETSANEEYDTITCFYADINRDGVINSIDKVAVRNSLGFVLVDSVVALRADVNNDGAVNDEDSEIVRQCFGVILP